MPSRLPVASGGSLINLKESTVENVRAQILTGDSSSGLDASIQNSTLTKEKLLSLSHGVVKNEDQRSVASEERGSDYMANPVRWENNAARKQLDLQWHFTCGPLRISEYAGRRHWDRLHSDNVAAIPQPRGGVHVMTSSIPHKSDAELEMEAAKIGLSSRSRPRSQLPPLPTRQPPSTPTLRQLLEERTTKPLPRRPPSMAGRSAVISDGSSAFSRTTVSHANFTEVSAANSKLTKTNNDFAEGSSRMGRVVGSSVGTDASNASSKKSSAESIRVDLERERTRQRDLASELREAAKRLETLESLLGQTS